MIELTPLQKKVAKFCAKEGYARSIRFIKASEGKATATDSHRLVEIEHIGSVQRPTELLDQKTFEQVDTEETYPEYEQFFAERKGDITIELNGKYLAEIAEVMSKLSKNNTKEITLSIPSEKNKPIIFHADGNDHRARALLMPIRQ